MHLDSRKESTQPQQRKCGTHKLLTEPQTHTRAERGGVSRQDRAHET